MLPVRKIEKTYTTLEEIRERKEQLATDIQKDNDRFSSLWSQMFVSRKDSSKGEWSLESPVLPQRAQETLVIWTIRETLSERMF